MDPNDMYHPYQQLALHSAATTPEMAAVAGGFPPAGFPVASMGSFAGNPGSQGQYFSLVFFTKAIEFVNVEMESELTSEMDLFSQ